ncbi:PCC domain-containing protein [Allopusillimonas ginsengisoli]|uniref:PCC domain-containing protein n=1 Tax=Allopusillimonas ginsengisoli TaxID=453575 RepID=UPI0039C0E7CB
MRSIVHPGPVAVDRFQCVGGRIEHLECTLAPGASLLEAISGFVSAHGAQSAVLTLRGGAFEPFSYVMPAESRSTDHAVYFSDRFDAQGEVQLLVACVTYGLRENLSFLHCHADWRDAQGRPGGGHLLPGDVVISQSIQASVWLMHGMGFVVDADAETNFSLFQPRVLKNQDQSQSPVAPGVSGYAVRVAPNVDVCTALEQACRAHGINKAVLHGGVGSLVGACFDDGRIVEPHITEVFIRHGVIEPGRDGEPVAAIDISMVDYTGQLSSGRLQRGKNAVLVTFEMVLEPVA